MAVMSDNDRAAANAELQREWSDERHVSPVTAGSSVRAAIDAADQWISDNASSFNTALPQPFRSAASAADKARLLMFVVRRRYLVGA